MRFRLATAFPAGGTLYVFLFSVCEAQPLCFEGTHSFLLLLVVSYHGTIYFLGGCECRGGCCRRFRQTCPTNPPHARARVADALIGASLDLVYFAQSTAQNIRYLDKYARDGWVLLAVFRCATPRGRHMCFSCREGSLSCFLSQGVVFLCC